MSDDIHNWFGLTYANYLVLPRAVLQSMPDEWQERFVACLNELREATDKAQLDVPSNYRVHVVDGRGRYMRDPIPHYRRAPDLLRVESVVGPSVWERIRSHE